MVGGGVPTQVLGASSPLGRSALVYMDYCTRRLWSNLLTGRRELGHPLSKASALGIGHPLSKADGFLGHPLSKADAICFVLVDQRRVWSIVESATSASWKHDFVTDSQSHTPSSCADWVLLAKYYCHVVEVYASLSSLCLWLHCQAGQFDCVFMCRRKL